MNIAWAAGLFEGEGTIRSNTPPNTMRYSLTMKLTDLDVLEKFHKVIGLGKIKRLPLTAPHHKPIWIWTLHNKAGCVSVLEKFLPYLGLRRAHKALDKLDDIELIHSDDFFR